MSWPFDELDEDAGSCDTVDVSGIVAEEDTTEGGKGTPDRPKRSVYAVPWIDSAHSHHVGLESDWGLDPVERHLGIHDSSARHVGKLGEWMWLKCDSVRNE